MSDNIVRNPVYRTVHFSLFTNCSTTKPPELYDVENLTCLVPGRKSYHLSEACISWKYGSNFTYKEAPALKITAIFTIHYLNVCTTSYVQLLGCQWYEWHLIHETSVLVGGWEGEEKNKVTIILITYVYYILLLRVCCCCTEERYNECTYN